MRIQLQIDEVEVSCSGSSTKMIRKFMSVFFTEDVLAKSSYYGSQGNNQLDGDIEAACMSKQNLTAILYYFRVMCKVNM